jgi:hypothetical protein
MRQLLFALVCALACTVAIAGCACDTTTTPDMTVNLMDMRSNPDGGIH